LRGCLTNARQDKEGGKGSEGCLANARQDRWGGKGLLRGESLSGQPEGALAPEGSPSILMGRRSERSESCLANARQDKRGRNEVRDALLTLGRTKRGRKEVRDASLMLGRTNGGSAGQMGGCSVG
jgi:hypothetical protein